MKYNLPKVVREKKAKKEADIKFWKIFLIEGLLFLITSVASVLAAFKLNELVLAEDIYLPKTSLQDFIFSFLFVIFFILIFIAHKKAGKLKEAIYKGFYIIIVLWGGITMANLFLPVFGSVLLVGAMIALWLKFPRVWLHNILIVLGLSGAAGFFGLGLASSVAVALLLIFSVYDFIAAYKTKNMVLMVKEMIDKKAVLGFIIPKEVKYFKNKLVQVKMGGNFMILGGGCVVFPSILAVSVLPSASGILRALVIVLFSVAGLFFSYWLPYAQKKFGESVESIPALPPIALSAIIGYLITLLF